MCTWYQGWLASCSHCKECCIVRCAEAMQREGCQACEEAFLKPVFVDNMTMVDYIMAAEDCPIPHNYSGAADWDPARPIAVTVDQAFARERHEHLVVWMSKRFAMYAWDMATWLSRVARGGLLGWTHAQIMGGDRAFPRVRNGDGSWEW